MLYSFCSYNRKSDEILTKQCKTPLFSALKKHAENNPTQFHIPSHKKGQGMDQEFKNFIGPNALSIDLINITPLDDLHSPHGIIKDAQDIAAEAFGADHTYFSVQGTSGAIMTMIMSVCNPGEKIIVPRNVHKSILSAIIFAGANPIYIHPEMDEHLGIAHGITPKSVSKALEAHSDAKGVLIINPTYFGVTANLKEIVDIVHAYNIPVLVDEAHGVHIHFHDELPLSAMQAGADLAATSVHKLGGSLTQSSILNFQGNLVDYSHIQSILSMLTTTSTSYVLLASLDTARRNLAINGNKLLSEAIELAHYLRRNINDINCLYCPGEDILGTDATYDYDPTKILVCVKDLGVTGYEVETWLRNNYNIEVELSDLYNILCLVSMGESIDNINKFINALQHLSEEFSNKNKLNHVKVNLPEIPVMSMSPRDAFYSDTDTVPFSKSAGHIIAEFIMIYPPGIPILIPGEVITEENIDYIKQNIAAGLPVKGPEDENLNTIKVIKERKAIPIY